MKNKINVKEITLASIIIVLLALMTFFPSLGSIKLPHITITLLHIPVILGTITMKNYKYAFIFGLAFGVLSFLANLQSPSAASYDLFLDPIIAILPRSFVGLTILAAYNLSYKAVENDIFSMIVAAIIGTITNTILVITAMGIFGGSSFANGLINAIQYIITINGSLEVAAAVILVPAIGKALAKLRG